MSKANSDKQGDADVLRAQDIVPPYNKKIQSSENITSPPAEKKVERDSDMPAEGADVEQKKGKIPKFDLAEEIMAEQRKITAIRRKAPPKTGPVRDPKDLGPRDKGSNGVGMIEAGVAGPDKKTELSLAQGQEAELDSTILQKNHKMGAQPIGYTVQPPPTLAEQEQIIAEIVARDIERLCGRLGAIPVG